MNSWKSDQATFIKKTLKMVVTPLILSKTCWFDSGIFIKLKGRSNCCSIKPMQIVLISTICSVLLQLHPTAGNWLQQALVLFKLIVPPSVNDCCLFPGANLCMCYTKNLN